MKLIYRVAVDILFLFHFAWVVVGLFGWLVPSIWPFYMAVLVLTILSYLQFGHCILTNWEFALRKKINPKLNIRSNWLPYYTHKYLHQHISDTFFLRAGLIFLAASLVLNIYFRYFFK